MGSAIALILLAAGASVRFGSAKQLVRYEGQTLLRRAVEAAMVAGCSPVIVVLGARAKEVRIEIGDLAVRVVENGDWEKGMGTSIRTGMGELAGDEAEAVIVWVCDQPLVDAKSLGQIIDAYRAGKGRMIAASYAGTLGVPALFGREYFPALGQLADESGAKQLLMRHAGEVVAIAMPEAALDIDTAADRDRLARGQ